MSAADLAGDLTRVAEVLRRSTVEIRSRGRGLGAGIIWPAPRGVLTNAHVVGQRDSTRVVFADGRECEGRVLRVDPRRDLALVDAPLDDLDPVVVRDAAELRTGELLLALGHPFGVAGSIAVGVVYARDSRWIRADLRLAPGFSGGPLADASGRVVGVNAMIGWGLGMAVPSEAITRFLGAPAAASAPRLGVALRPVAIAGRHGFLVLEIAPRSAAQEGGLYIGDVIVALDGKPFAGPRSLTAALLRRRPGSVLALEIIRAGVGQQLRIPLQAQESEAA